MLTFSICESCCNRSDGRLGFILRPGDLSAAIHMRQRRCHGLDCFALFCPLTAIVHRRINHVTHRLVERHGYRLYHVMADSESSALRAMVCTVTGLATLEISNIFAGVSNVHRFVLSDVGSSLSSPTSFISSTFGSQPNPLPWFDPGESGGLQNTIPADPREVGNPPALVAIPRSWRP